MCISHFSTVTITALAHTHTQLIRWKSENESDQRVAVIQLVDQLSSHMLVPTGQLTFVSLSVCVCVPLDNDDAIMWPRERDRERRRRSSYVKSSRNEEIN